jgi:hypothetical protein
MPCGGGGRLAKLLLHFPFELVHVEIPGIDHFVGQRADPFQGFALARDALLNRILPGQRMRPAGLTEAPQSKLHRMRRRTSTCTKWPAPLNPASTCGNACKKLAAAQINAERDAPEFFLIAVTKIDKFRDEQRGKIIDAENPLSSNARMAKLFPEPERPVMMVMSSPPP